MTGLRAVFLDRDGVLTEPVWNSQTAAFESPHRLADLRLCDDALAALKSLNAAEFALFIVSNQPSYAKGKVSKGVLMAIAERVEALLREAGTPLVESYYCFHHPDAIVPSLRGKCRCRKPEAYFLLKAAQKHSIDLARSWMVGDRDSDIVCGQTAGCRTVLITHPHARDHQSTSAPDHVAKDLRAAAAIMTETMHSPLTRHDAPTTLGER
jgi:D-glycero-D-manno-heptose 1,7-bisphosphate phosphatase